MLPFEAHHAFAFFSDTCRNRAQGKERNNDAIHMTRSHTTRSMPKRAREHALRKAYVSTALTTLLFPPSTSILLPRTTKGNSSLSAGFACIQRQSMEKRSQCKEWSLLNGCFILTYLNQELLSPVIQVIKRLHYVDIVHKDTTVSTAVKCNA